MYSYNTYQTKMCLKSTYFQYEDLICEHKDGTAMGSPLSPNSCQHIYGRFWIYHHHNSWQTTKGLVLLCWWHLVICEHGRQYLNEFLIHINGLHSRIQFKLEVEDNNKTAFLDVLVERREHSMFTTVYRKPTLTDRYLNYWSHHHPRTKIGIVSCLRKRAENICGDQEPQIEDIKRLECIFLGNERMGVIYKIPCECGDVYIKETGWNLKQRMEGKCYSSTYSSNTTFYCMGGVWSHRSGVPLGEKNGQRSNTHQRNIKSSQYWSWDDTKVTLSCSCQLNLEISKPKTFRCIQN